MSTLSTAPSPLVDDLAAWRHNHVRVLPGGRRRVRSSRWQGGEADAPQGPMVCLPSSGHVILVDYAASAVFWWNCSTSSGVR